MKKVIIGLAGLVVMAFVVVLVVSARSTDTEEVKACSETVKECTMTTSAPASCCPSAAKATAETAGTAECKVAGCDHENCTGTCKETATAAKCPALCPMHTASK